ncbi:hypothetical protein [Superficieibacter sp. HKU1]|uniref:hypothetical protein n=1 Tax=Superficieibacter sp. HKU1 TaxID=3031919 RepID=UPI0023E203E8|nr:hypothetical protein [Superficieibacter sp. HKU1]WES69136.1 hypothetical protein P0H77_03745 [Superficieibacter sp. HKU1]
MNKTSHPKPTSQGFDIHAKLRAANSHWSYLHATQPHDEGFNYQFITTLVDEIEFAVYERIDGYFVLVDFFKSYNEACEEAKSIIDSHPDIKKIFTSNQ